MGGKLISGDKIAQLIIYEILKKKGNLNGVCMALS